MMNETETKNVTLPENVVEYYSRHVVFLKNMMIC